MPALKLRRAWCKRKKASCLKARRSRQKFVLTGKAEESASEVRCANDKPGVYKMSMVRMCGEMH